MINANAVWHQLLQTKRFNSRVQPYKAHMKWSKPNVFILGSNHKQGAYEVIQTKRFYSRAQPYKAHVKGSKPNVFFLGPKRDVRGFPMWTWWTCGGPWANITNWSWSAIQTPKICVGSSHFYKAHIFSANRHRIRYKAHVFLVSNLVDFLFFFINWGEGMVNSHAAAAPLFNPRLDGIFRSCMGIEGNQEWDSSPKWAPKMGPQAGVWAPYSLTNLDN